MRKSSCTFLAATTLLFVQNMVCAQTDTVRNRVQIKIGLFYNSHLHYYGRTDSLRSSGIFPLAEVWFTKKIYLNAAPVFVHNASQRLQYAGTVTMAGFQFNNKKWAGNFYFAKPFYQSNSQLVQSALKAQVSGVLTLKNDIVNFTSSGDIRFSDKADFTASIGIDHLFSAGLPGNAVLVVDPMATVNAGTQQFTNTYYKKNDFLFLPGVEEKVSDDVNKFSVLSYEFSVPVILAKGKLQVLLIPAYVIPQNLIRVADRPDLSETGKSLFYATVGTKVIF